MTRQNPAGLGRSDTTAAIEEAFFIALRGGHARPRMIRCAVDALCAGQGGPATVSLAGADAQVPLPALLELFRAAAAELGLALPESPGHTLWLARHADAIEPRICDPTLHRTPEDRFVDDLRVLSANLAAACPRHASMQRFLTHLGLFIDRRIDRYETWLQTLDDVASEIDADVVRRVSSLFHAISYGALEDAHLRTVRDLRARSERL